MRENKNIDQLLNSLDHALEVNDSSTQINLNEIAKKYQKQQLDERRTVAKKIILIISIGIFLIAIIPNLFVQINIAAIALLFLLSFGLNYKAQKEINSQDLATTYSEFKEQKKTIALKNLKLSQRFRILFYLILIWCAFSYVFEYFSNPDTLKLVVYLTIIPLGIFASARVIENNVKEHLKRVKAQD